MLLFVENTSKIQLWTVLYVQKMELILYIVINIFALVMCTKRVAIASKKLMLLIWASTYLVMVFTVRAQFDYDINTYALSMEYSSLSLYYIKEPVIWLGQRLLFNITDSSYLTFILTDISAGVILYRALKIFSLPQYSYFSFLTFFPFIMGFQNIYRQWFASIIMIYLISLIVQYDNKRLKKYFIFAISILTHNVSAIFLPFLFLKPKNTLSKIFLLLALIIAVLGVKYGLDTKSSRNTGGNLAFAYLSLFLVIVIILIIIDFFKITLEARWHYIFIVVGLILSTTGIIFGGSSAAERISIYLLMLMYPLLIVKIEERFKNPQIVRMIMTICGFFPIFVFGTATFIL